MKDEDKHIVMIAIVVSLGLLAFFAGDLFTVTMNGRNLPLDLNGVPSTAVILSAKEI
jgi:hypothetical protein